jgi:hypothetical protein
MRRSRFLFTVSVLCLLLFQGWLAEFRGVKYADLPEVKSEEEADVVARAITAVRARKADWVRTWGIPETLERKLYQLAELRRVIILCCGGKTLIDGEVSFHSAKDFPLYLPRALQVGLLSPMPGLWGGQGSSPAMTLARKIVGAATCFFYVCLIGFFAGLFIFRRNLHLWVITVYCLLGILVYTFTYPNVGTLMRYRYGFHMTLISFGAAVVLDQVLAWRGRRRPNG